MATPDDDADLSAGERPTFEVKDWTDTVIKARSSIQLDQTPKLWPRDTLFEYLTSMQQLQECIQERQELQILANIALYNIVQHSAE